MKQRKISKTRPDKKQVTAAFYLLIALVFASSVLIIQNKIEITGRATETAAAIIKVSYSSSQNAKITLELAGVGNLDSVILKDGYIVEIRATQSNTLTGLGGIDYRFANVQNAHTIQFTGAPNRNNKVLQINVAEGKKLTGVSSISPNLKDDMNIAKISFDRANPTTVYYSTTSDPARLFSLSTGTVAEEPAPSSPSEPIPPPDTGEPQINTLRVVQEGNKWVLYDGNTKVREADSEITFGYSGYYNYYTVNDVNYVVSKDSKYNGYRLYNPDIIANREAHTPENDANNVYLSKETSPPPTTTTPLLERTFSSADEAKTALEKAGVGNVGEVYLWGNNKDSNFIYSISAPSGQTLTNPEKINPVLADVGNIGEVGLWGGGNLHFISAPEGQPLTNPGRIDSRLKDVGNIKGIVLFDNNELNYISAPEGQPLTNPEKIDSRLKDVGNINRIDFPYGELNKVSASFGQSLSNLGSINPKLNGVGNVNYVRFNSDGSLASVYAPDANGKSLSNLEKIDPDFAKIQTAKSITFSDDFIEVKNANNELIGFAKVQPGSPTTSPPSATTEEPEGSQGQTSDGYYYRYNDATSQWETWNANTKVWEPDITPLLPEFPKSSGYSFTSDDYMNYIDNTQSTTSEVQEGFFYYNGNKIYRDGTDLKEYDTGGWDLGYDNTVGRIDENGNAVFDEDKKDDIEIITTNGKSIPLPQTTINRFGTAQPQDSEGLDLPPVTTQRETYNEQTGTLVSEETISGTKYYNYDVNNDNIPDFSVSESGEKEGIAGGFFDQHTTPLPPAAPVTQPPATSLSTQKYNSLEEAKTALEKAGVGNVGQVSLNPDRSLSSVSAPSGKALSNPEKLDPKLSGVGNLRVVDFNSDGSLARVYAPEGEPLSNLGSINPKLNGVGNVNYVRFNSDGSLASVYAPDANGESLSNLGSIDSDFASIQTAKYIMFSDDFIEVKNANNELIGFAKVQPASATPLPPAAVPPPPAPQQPTFSDNQLIENTVKSSLSNSNYEIRKTSDDVFYIHDKSNKRYYFIDSNGKKIEVSGMDPARFSSYPLVTSTGVTSPPPAAPSKTPPPAPRPVSPPPKKLNGFYFAPKDGYNYIMLDLEKLDDRPLLYKGYGVYLDKDGTTIREEDSGGWDFGYDNAIGYLDKRTNTIIFYDEDKSGIYAEQGAVDVNAGIKSVPAPAKPTTPTDWTVMDNKNGNLFFYKTVNGVQYKWDASTGNQWQEMASTIINDKESGGAVVYGKEGNFISYTKGDFETTNPDVYAQIKEYYAIGDKIETTADKITIKDKDGAKLIIDETSNSFTSTISEKGTEIKTTTTYDSNKNIESIETLTSTPIYTLTKDGKTTTFTQEEYDAWEGPKDSIQKELLTNSETYFYSNGKVVAKETLEEYMLDGKTYSVKIYYNKDREPLSYEDTSKTDAQNKAALEKLQSQYKWSKGFKMIDNLDRFQGFSYLSSLLLKEEFVNEWKEEVDNFFCESIILGDVECWSSKVCQMQFDKTSDGVAYTLQADNTMGASAHVEGERSMPFEIPGNGTTYLYKLTYYVKSQKEDISFNVVLLGEKTSKLYSSDIKLKGNEDGSGQQFAAVGPLAVTNYSAYKYEKICLRFSDRGDIEDNELCNTIVETDYTPTLLEEETVSASSSESSSAPETSVPDDQYTSSQKQQPMLE